MNYLLRFLRNKKKKRNIQTTFQVLSPDVYLYHSVNSIPILNWFTFNKYSTLYNHCSPLNFGSYTDNLIKVRDLFRQCVSIRDEEQRTKFFDEKVLTTIDNLHTGHDSNFKYIFCCVSSLNTKTTNSDLLSEEKLIEGANRLNISGEMMRFELLLAEKKLITEAKELFPELYSNSNNYFSDDIAARISLFPKNINSIENLNNAVSQIEETERFITNSIDFINTGPKKGNIPNFLKTYDEKIDTIIRMMGYKRKDLVDVLFPEFWREFIEKKKEMDKKNAQIIK